MLYNKDKKSDVSLQCSGALGTLLSHFFILVERYG